MFRVGRLSILDTKCVGESFDPRVRSADVRQPTRGFGVEKKVISQMSRRLIQYYTALRLSAGAAMLYLPFETPEPRVPVVRSAETSGPDGFDRREVIVHGGRISVVTLPLAPQRASDQPQIGLN
jgi:hypothetical protein